MIRAIIFDFFGVIRTDAYKSWLQTHHHKMEGEFLDAVQALDRGQTDVRGFLTRIGAATGKDPDALFDEMEATAGLDHEVLSIIQSLAGNYKLGLLSNSSAAFLRGVLKQHDLEKYFDAVVISSEAGLLKPDPKIFDLILRQLGVNPNETIFIDDAPVNVAAANQKGIHAILYTSCKNLQNNLARLGI